MKSDTGDNTSLDATVNSEGSTYVYRQSDGANCVTPLAALEMGCQWVAMATAGGANKGRKIGNTNTLIGPTYHEIPFNNFAYNENSSKTTKHL